jgi:hypothetical protein
MKQPVQSHTVFSIALESDDEYETLFSDDNEMYDVLTDMRGVEWAMMEDGCILFAVAVGADAKAISGRAFRQLQSLKRRALEEAPEGLDSLPDPVIEAAKANNWDAQEVCGHLIDFVLTGGANVYRLSKPFHAEGQVLLGYLSGAFDSGAEPTRDLPPVLEDSMSAAGLDVSRIIEISMEFLEADLSPESSQCWADVYEEFVHSEIEREQENRIVM